MIILFNFNTLGVNISEFVIRWSQLGRNDFFHNVRGKVRHTQNSDALKSLKNNPLKKL